MLVISRKPRESIVIGRIVIKILSGYGGEIRLGIEAPEGIPVWRKELFDQFPLERQEALYACTPFLTKPSEKSNETPIRK